MLFRIDFEISVYPDRIQVADRRSGTFVDHRADTPFSSPDALIADAVYFEHALTLAVRKALSGGFILLDAQATLTGGADELDDTGRQLVRRALRDIGFKTIAFEDPDAPLPAPRPRTAREAAYR